MNARPPKARRHPPTDRPFASAVGLVSDWIEFVRNGELDADTIERLHRWHEYLTQGGPPPPPLPLNPTDKQVDQALRSFIRNVERSSRTRFEARLHDLRLTVSELITMLTSQSRAIATTRNTVHELLHAVEEVSGESDAATEAIRTIRSVLRQLDEEAQRNRSMLNERLQELRTALLERVVLGGRITDTVEEREVHFRALASAARLFGEAITIIQIDGGKTKVDVAKSADAVRQVFRRDRDVVCVTGTQITVVVMDTPRRAALRMIRTVAASVGLVDNTTIRLVSSAELYGSVDDALEFASEYEVRGSEDNA